MKKIIFSDNTELEISNISDAGSDLKIEIESSDVNSIILKFHKNSAATEVMRFYVGIDLMKGYAGYTEMTNLQYVPHVTTSVDYETTDNTTESGFAETYADKTIVTMRKPAESTQEDVSSLESRVTQVEQNIQSINDALEGIE